MDEARRSDKAWGAAEKGRRERRTATWEEGRRSGNNLYKKKKLEVAASLATEAANKTGGDGACGDETAAG